MTVPIYYFTPARSDKNIGKALNDHCSSVPEDGWIVIRDCDTMFLTPNYSKHIEDIVYKYGDKYDLIGCMTNRANMKQHLINGLFSEDTDVKNHVNLSLRLEKEKWAEVVQSSNYIAGHFMLFSKKAWNEHKFEEGAILTKKKVNGKVVIGFFDYWFSNYFYRRKRVGIATGLYIFHLYRLFQPSTKINSHLL